MLPVVRLPRRMKIECPSVSPTIPGPSSPAASAASAQRRVFRLRQLVDELDANARGLANADPLRDLLLLPGLSGWRHFRGFSSRAPRPMRSPPEEVPGVLA